MSLSEQEQRALREIEKSLLAEDPKFGSSVDVDTSFAGTGGAITLRGVALVVVGLVMMIGGVALAQTSLWFVILSIAGFLVMFGAGVWMLRANSAESLFKGASARTASARPVSDSAAKKTSKMEENFRRRFEER